MDEAEDAGTFTLLVDRPLSAVVRVAVWCPTMDLIALAAADGQLSVRRLNWQSLWSVTPGADAATGGSGGSAEAGRGDAVVWRPDGKALAVGGADGAVTMLDAEDGKQVMQRQLCAGASLVALSQHAAFASLSHYIPCSSSERHGRISSADPGQQPSCRVLCRAGPVVSMAWAESQEGPDAAADQFSNRAARLLPPLPKASKAAGAAVTVSSRADWALPAKRSSWGDAGSWPRHGMTMAWERTLVAGVPPGKAPAPFSLVLCSCC